MAEIQFCLRELMARKARLSGESITYETISRATGISSNTLSRISQNRMNQIGVNSTLVKLCLYLDCEPGELMILIKD